MNRKAVLRLGGTLLLVLLFGTTSTATAPDSVHFGGMWPAGLASGALLITPRMLAPYVAGLIAVLASISFAVGGYPVDVALGYGVGAAVESVLVQQVLTAGWTRRAHLRSNSDFGRFVLACSAGAAAGAVVFTVVSEITSFGTPWKVGLATLLTHAAAQVVLLGLFKERSHHAGEYAGFERWAAWLNTVVITTIAFVPTGMPSIAFLVVPGLGWIALRAPMREAMFQLVVVAVISSTLTSAGHGPFADPILNRNLDPEFRLLPLQAFLIACAMMTIPFSMAVGAQRQSRTEVLVERARSERLVQSARGIAIIGTDVLGRIDLFSPGAELILGYRPEEVFGHSTRLFHTQAEIARQAAELGCPPTYLEVVRATVSLPPGSARDWEFIRKDGSARWLSTILSPITDENGALTGYVATADDITDRLETQSALEAALMSEREAVERLMEIDQVKDRFVSSVSHELRTPITNIVGYLELLMDGVYGAPNQEQTRAMSRIDLNSRRLLTLIDDLLTLSSMESLNQPRELAPVDLVAVLRRAEEIVTPSLMRRDLRLDVAVPAQPVVIPGDSGQLERLVINLATNAVKFTLDGGRVTLRLIAPHDGAGPVIEVEDTGIGIPEADQEMLFNRFYRATQAREAAVPGSGLGLSIAKSIAELHGGQISATSVYGKGSTFRVEFPPATVSVPAQSDPR
ncbi:sensor histidine kinase [Nocardioides pocheonensis]|uniref:histidine kinase n=1 Tax=Nocardioides pocheonensis TaxID=661485 RepID=A0A3N0GMT8_9ACTN|nr:ATP-binding protein [Nocardioides pocheonensis]RNM13711.1 PAS domain S-box protein [Nocardioides pocheonensis]